MRKLSDVAMAYERSAEALEDAQDDLTTGIQALQARVDAASKAHFAESDALFTYLRANLGSCVIYGDTVYSLERGQIARKRVVWSHTQWVEDPPPRITTATEAAASVIKTAWGKVEPDAGEAHEVIVEGEWQEPNGQPVTAEMCDDCP